MLSPTLVRTDRQPMPMRRDVEWLDAITAVLADRRPVAMRYQPIVDVQRGVVAGYEALARFPGPPYGSPDQWFQIAAVHGCGIALEGHLIGSTLDAVDALPPQARLMVNVSPAFLHTAAWRRLLERHSDMHRVVIEITEDTPISDYHAVGKIVDQARQRGALLAVDDLGSGYAGMQHVLKLRPDFVKLDRTLIADCHRHASSMAMIDAVSIVAHSVGSCVIAEGVERDEELACLMRLGIPLVQGWLLGKPQPTMAGLTESAQRVTAAHQRRMADRSLVDAFVDACSPVAAEGSLSIAPVRPTLVVDAECRPVTWVGPGLPETRREPFLVKIGTPLCAVVAEAQKRDDASRLLPVVCTDAAGRYVGVVRLDQLIAGQPNSAADLADGRHSSAIRRVT